MPKLRVLIVVKCVRSFDTNTTQAIESVLQSRIASTLCSPAKDLQKFVTSEVHLPLAQSIIRRELEQPEQNLIIRGGRQSEFVCASDDPLAVDEVAVLALHGIGKFEGLYRRICALGEDREGKFGEIHLVARDFY
jgi:hypothetical protein